MAMRRKETPVPYFQCPKCGKFSVIFQELDDRFNYNFLVCAACDWERKMDKGVK
jgi:transcription elongation factor Elf1